MSERQFEDTKASYNPADSVAIRLLAEMPVEQRFDPKISEKPSIDDFTKPFGAPVLDFTIPLDRSQAKAPREFLELTPNSHKTGVDGIVESVKDTWVGVFGKRDTLHDHARMLARAGMTPAEREQLAKEEEQVKAYNESTGSSTKDLRELIEKGDYDKRPVTPMLDELDRRTLALEKSTAELAKRGMTPLQVAQLESGAASSQLKDQYESQLIALMAAYDSNGAVPQAIYDSVVAAARDEKIRDEQIDVDPRESDNSITAFGLDNFFLTDWKNSNRITTRPEYMK